MQPGSTVNQRYEILAELGRGGMGVVYHARSIGLGKEVAIKIFNDSVSAEATKRAQREAQALANVRHPNLVHVYSLETDEAQRLMLVFDFIAGKPLSTILQERTLTQEEISSLFEQLCNGLTALHSNGFVHRDLKPSNLMITNTPNNPMHLTIIDFGLAKSMENSQKLTKTGSVLGTPAYMSPEQFSGEEITAQSDLYSAACVLYEMMVGTTPFNDESPYMVAHAHMNKPPPKLGGPIDNFLQKALAKQPSDRFSDARELLNAFRKIEGKLPVAPRVAISNRSPSKNRQLRVFSAAAAVCILAAVAFFIAHQRLAGRGPETPIEMEAQRVFLETQRRTDPPPKSKDEWRRVLHFLEFEVATLEKRGAEEAGGDRMMHVYRNYSEALHYDSKTSQARDASLKALKIAERLQNKGMEATIWGELGYVCASEQRFPESLQWYRKFASKLGGGLEKLKGNEWMHAAHALASLERADELIQLYESRLVGNDTQGHVMHSNRRHLAYAYMQKGRYREAAQLVEQNKYASADVSTQDGRVFDLIPLTMAYAFDGRGQQAMAALKETEAHPHFADIVGFNEGVKALVAAKSGDRRAAKANLDKALELDYHYREPDTRKDRDTIFQGIRFLRLSKEAAAIIGDKQREQAVSERIQELKDELRSGGFF